MTKLDPKISKKSKLKVCSKALHPEFLYPLIAVSEMSIEKGYEPFNWLTDKNVTVTYLIEAAQRHLDKIKLGIDVNDNEITLDGASCKNKPLHAACVAYNMLMLCLQIEKRCSVDDRLFKNGILITKQSDYLNKVSRGYAKKLVQVLHRYRGSYACDTNKCVCNVTRSKNEEEKNK